jgi:MinD-like ATPase involved in chromosome partitioning or flagellar assembly
MARDERQRTLLGAAPLTGPNHDAVPQWPTLTVTLRADGTGELHLSPSTTEHIEAESLEQARRFVLSKVAAYAEDNHHRAVRLRVQEPDGEWLLGVNPDGTGFELTDDTQPAGERHPQAPDDLTPSQSPTADAPNPPLRRLTVTDADADAEPLAPAVRVTSPGLVSLRSPTDPGDERWASAEQTLGRDIDREALHARPPGPMTRLVESVGERLKDSAQREEEQLDQQFTRRYVVTETNLPVVVSPKGGPGKTTVAVIIGDALASRLPNQRVAAVDFNPGGGALEAVATEDRGARFSLLQLHSDRDQVRSHAQLQPYVASLQSGLDLLAVPPNPDLALSITPGHYADLFDEVLIPNYNVLVLDTSPDITSPVTQLALQRGTQMIIVLEQGYVSSGVVIHSLPYLLEQPAAGGDGSEAIVVINRVMDDPRAGALQPLRDEIRKAHAGPIIEIPWDLDLRADIDSGTYTLDHVKQRATRLSLKRLALAVTQNFR